MSETLLIDCAWTKPSPAAVKAAGYEGVIGYISHGDPGEDISGGKTPAKDMSAAQAKRYRAAGLMVGLVFETTADRAKSGQSGGAADCAFAEAHAAKRGYPAGCVIFYAVDFDASPQQILGYFRGIKATHSRYGWGPYGSARVVAAVDTKLAPTACWQTVAWSGGVVSHHADIYQRAKRTVPAIKGVARASYDEDVLVHPVALWGATHAKPAAKTPAVKPSTSTPRQTEAQIMRGLARYAKAHTAGLGALGTWLGVALKDGHVSNGEWIALVGVIATALGVAAIPNAKPKGATK